METAKRGSLATNVGRANTAELVAQGRLTYNATRGFNYNPSPKMGHVINEESGMRSGLTPEIYHDLCLKQAGLAERGILDRCAPDLEAFEWSIYKDWLVDNRKTDPITGFNGMNSAVSNTDQSEDEQDPVEPKPMKRMGRPPKSSTIEIS